VDRPRVSQIRHASPVNRYLNVRQAGRLDAAVALSGHPASYTLCRVLR
jgi:hypothetical protein